VPNALSLSEGSRRPRIQRRSRQRRTWANRDERPLFATDSQRIARVVVDPRLATDSLPRPLQFILDNPHVEVGTVGYSSTCDVEIHPPDHGVVPLSGDHGRRLSAIHLYDNLQQFAAARAVLYGVDAEALREGLVFTNAAAFWKANFFISDSEGLQTPAGGYTRELDIQTVDMAIPLLGLFLRCRGQCVAPGEIPSFREWDPLPPWWFYRVGAWAVLPEAHIWRENWPAEKRANPTPDWAGLELYDDPPIQGLIGRIANGLRVRDRVLSGMFALEGNESHQVVLYETESLMLQLSSTLDLVAKIVGQQFRPPIPKKEWAWTNPKFRAALRKAWPELPDEVLSFVRTTAQLLALIRNRIHAGPPAPVAGDDAVWFALASEDQAEFELRARDLGGTAIWGLCSPEGSKECCSTPGRWQSEPPWLPITPYAQSLSSASGNSPVRRFRHTLGLGIHTPLRSRCSTSDWGRVPATTDDMSRVLNFPPKAAAVTSRLVPRGCFRA
jgi:hypothetical protein